MLPILRQSNIYIILVDNATGIQFIYDEIPTVIMHSPGQAFFFLDRCIPYDHGFPKSTARVVRSAEDSL